MLMDVFVIPIGRDRYELYCEPSAEVTAGDAADPQPAVIGRLRDRFNALVHAAEEWHRHGQPEAGG